VYVKDNPIRFNDPTGGSASETDAINVKVPSVNELRFKTQIEEAKKLSQSINWGTSKPAAPQHEAVLRGPYTPSEIRIGEQKIAETRAQLATAAMLQSGNTAFALSYSVASAFTNDPIERGKIAITGTLGLYAAGAFVLARGSGGFGAGGSPTPKMEVPKVETPKTPESAGKYQERFTDKPVELKLPEQPIKLLPAPEIPDFSGVKTLRDFLSRIPSNAVRLPWKDIPEGAKQGVKFIWTDAYGNKWRAWAHEMDPTAPSNSNAATGWIFRIQIKPETSGTGKWFFGEDAYYKENYIKKNNEISNKTHVPINRGK